MFRVFSKFNALLVRPKVRGAIGEYQSQLLDNVKQDISTLQERFKAGYADSEAQIIAQLRDIPPEAGSMIWMRQIENQLDSYLSKVKAVLGEDWTQHTDGGRLYEESQKFRERLKIRAIFEMWQNSAQRDNIAVEGRIFFVKQTRAPSGILELHVNFDDQAVALFKEVRSMGWLGQAVRHALAMRGREAHDVYPYALSLMESIKIYTSTMNLIEEHAELAQLMAGYISAAQNLFTRGIQITWIPFIHNEQSFQSQQANGIEPSTLLPTTNAHVNFVRDLAASTNTLQEKFLTLTNANDTVQRCMRDLHTCEYSSNAFQTNLSAMQNAADKLNLENYSNLELWVESLNRRLQDILKDRLLEALRLWSKVFGSTTDEINLIERGQTDLNSRLVADTLTVEAEISMHNQTIFVEPPINHVKAQWSHSLQSQIEVVCGLQQVQATRYQTSTALNISRKRNHFSELAVACLEQLTASNRTIESTLAELNSYLEEWYRYQSLWDLQIDHIQDTLGEDLDLWHQLIQEIRQSRSTFDTSDVRKPLGFVIFDYEQVQAKITQKYDQWQHEITIRFGLNLSNRMRETIADLKRARNDLEQQSLEASSTAQAVSFITIVQHCKRQASVWEPEIEVFRQGQTTLSRQRYNFGNDWLSATQVSDEWDAFSEILGRKGKVVEEQTDALRAKITAEDRLIQDKMLDIASQWAEDKPVSGTIPPAEALDILSTFQNKLEKLQSDFETVAKAKEALALAPTQNDTLLSTLEDVQDFTSVWSALSTIWQSISEQRETLWTSLQPRKLRQSLENLVKTAREMPSRMRQYTAFEHMQDVLKKLQKSNALITDLKTDAIRERHWLKIWKALRPVKRYSEVSLILGDVWDLNLTANESVVRDVILQAQGELALEEFVRSVRETWQNYSLDLVNYQSKLRLIRGWDDLFTKCSENLNSLQAMRHSPYYKEFEDEAASWEDKLNRVHVLFDVWIDVQRQWVYLEGVFSGNNDIKHLLPTESSRFSNINTEFYAIMKKVYKSPLIMDVLVIPGVQKSLDRLAELLSKIQKALGEYLERERVSFPRFYFVGDEDLLEIIGNSNETSRVAKHFKKMFAGISGVEVNEENTIIAITFKEDELVPLRKEVSLIKTPKINDWLAALDMSSKLTLA
ncbi:dynein heavy chain, partial [Elasticomyces elasticus]